MTNAAARTYFNSLREFRFVSWLWLAAFLWTLGWCYLRGYQHAPDSWLAQIGLAQPRTPENFRTILGMPDWVFVGIILPWVTCSIITVWFGGFRMTDDDLGVEAEGSDHA